MKQSLLGLILMTASATALAQNATPITVPQPPGTAATGTITMSGCVGGGVGSAPITMTSPTIVPSTIQPGSVASSATFPTGQPSTAPPVYQPPSTSSTTVTPGTTTPTPGAPIAAPGSGVTGTAGTSTGSIGATGTTGTTGSTATGSIGTTGTTSVSAMPSPSAVSPGGTTSLSGAGPTGYQLMGTDMSSWVGRRVQIVGTMAPATSSADATSLNGGNAAALQQFQVQSVVPLTGPCPQP